MITAPDCLSLASTSRSVSMANLAVSMFEGIYTHMFAI